MIYIKFNYETSRFENLSKSANQLLNVSILSIDSTAWSQYLSLFFSHYKQTFEGSRAVFWATNLFQSQPDLWWLSLVTSLLLGAGTKRRDFIHQLQKNLFRANYYDCQVLIVHCHIWLIVFHNKAWKNTAQISVKFLPSHHVLLSRSPQHCTLYWAHFQE